MNSMKWICCLAVAACIAACGGEKTPTGPSVPDVPTGLKLHSTGDDSFTFQWDPMEGALSYDWQLLGETNAVLLNGNVTKRNVTVSPVDKGVNYGFRVRSVNEEGSSDWCASVAAKIEKPDNPPGPGPEPPVETLTYEDLKIPACEEDGKARAFPGAEGGGMYTTGGRGGNVYHVTNLNDSGEGSLRYGITNGARPLTIVFDVAGIIELNSTLNVSKGDLTIAGQTAPGDGICLKNYTFRISASNVIVRFIRCRMGDEKKVEDDAMQILSHDDNKYKNIIIDHCSVSWCTDECASFYGMQNFSFQWNIISESLRVSVHGKGNHGYGGIWGGENASYHHNLLAHHDSRNPRIDHDYVSTQKGPLSLVNNVIYNWMGNTCYGGESANTTNTYRKYNIINNYYRPGPATSTSKIWFLDPTTSCSNCTTEMNVGTVVPGHFYMTGNTMHGYNAMTSDNWTGTTKSDLVSTIKSNEPFTYASNPSSISIQSAADAYAAVVANAGASYARDAIDTRVAKEANNGTHTYIGSKGSTKGIIDTQSDVGGWPEYTATAEQKSALADTDGDGMSDAFEDAFGLNKNSAADGKTVSIDKHGRYTNLEMYLHYIVREIVASQNAGGTYTQL